MVSIELSSRVYPGFAVVALTGELDAASAHAAATAIQAGIGPGRRVIVDLGAVQFAACHALGALAVATKRARRAGGGVLLAAAQAAVLRVLELTGRSRAVLWGRVAEHTAAAGRRPDHGCAGATVPTDSRDSSSRELAPMTSMRSTLRSIRLSSAPRDTRRTPRPSGHPLGVDLADRLLARLSESGSTEASSIAVLVEAIEASGAVVVANAGHDPGFDLGAWSDDLEAIGGNPLLVEVRRSLVPGAVEQVLYGLAATPPHVSGWSCTRAGDVLLVEDTEGFGHSSESAEGFVAAFVPLGTIWFDAPPAVTNWPTVRPRPVAP
jgi:anti-anti-sigma factor